MSFSREVSLNSSYARSSLSISVLAAVALVLATLATGVVSAADGPDDEAESAAAADTGSRQADRSRDAEADERAADAAGKAETDEVREIESEVTVREQVPVERCRMVRSTGSRVPKEVCTTVTPTTEGDRAAATAQEQRTRDYLRRRDELSTRQPEDTGFIGGNPGGGTGL